MRLLFEFGRAAVAALFLVGSAAPADTLLSTSELVATTSAATAALPPAIAFDVTTAGTYEIELRDAQFPAALDNVRAVVVHDGQAVADVNVQAGQTGTDTFTATSGAHRIHVLGAPGSGQTSGSFGVRVRAVSGGAVIVNETGTVNAAASASETTFIALVPVQIATPGTYSVDVIDQQFPAALQSREAIVLQSGNVVMTPTSTFPASFDAAQAGEYIVSVQVETDASHAGLYGVRVSNGTVTPLDALQEVGSFPAPTLVTLPSSAQYTLSTSDAQFPQSLDSFRTLVFQGSSLLANQAGPATNVAFDAAAGEVKVYTSVVPNGTAGVGSVGVTIAQAGSTVYSSVLIADADADPASPSIYVAAADGLAAGGYRLVVEDFGFPATLSTLRVAVAQSASIVDDWIGEGQHTFNVNAGAARVLIVASPSSSTATGLFGFRLEPQAGGDAIIESNQGVGGLFRTHLLTVTAAGSRDIRLSDVAFPTALQSSALAVTRGTTLVGQLFGGAQLRSSLDPGTYVLSFLGKPDATQAYGTYALVVEDSPAPPTLTFTATPASVATGQTATLQWTASNATSCTATGGWSGARDASGSFTTAALSAATTYQLSCVGAGGSIEQSVTVQISAPDSGSGSGGGGALSVLELCALLLAALLWLARRAVGHT